MRPSGKLSAAIEILNDFEARRVPLKTAIADWSRNNRYAGAKDRAWISGLCLDVLRKRHSLAAMMRSDHSRALALGAIRFLWKIDLDELRDIAKEEPHGPGALTEEEQDLLSGLPLIPAKAGIQKMGAMDSRFHENKREDGSEPYVIGDFPEWLTPQVERVFGDNAAEVMALFAERADVDLRVNTLKTTPEKAIGAVKSVKGQAIPILNNALRIPAPDPSQKAPSVTIIPAFNKGWVEVQDLGSQIAAAAAGDVKGAQVLDFCAGGGGKTLALAALMENTGQLYAYDIDARRLQPIYARAKRAGVRNLQVRSPAGGEGLDDLAGKMDVVFIDAPCTGAGTWRRRPDTKWRLTEKQLQARITEQDKVLDNAAQYVKPGGRMIYATCSFLMEENEDRLDTFFSQHKDFSYFPVFAALDASGLITEQGVSMISPCITPEGALRLTPDRVRADGFFVAVLERQG
ncbi:MAG: RsmB/NOP family class I SAM-dependent RNA methyltransferase [Pseudomonadota bacterium]